MIIKKLPFLTPEEANEVIKGRKEDEVRQFNDDLQDDDSDDDDDDNADSRKDDNTDKGSSQKE
jgi:hypothetical protein